MESTIHIPQFFLISFFIFRFDVALVFNYIFYKKSELKSIFF